MFDILISVIGGFIVIVGVLVILKGFVSFGKFCMIVFLLIIIVYFIGVVGVVVLNIEVILQVIKSIFYYVFVFVLVVGGFVGLIIMMVISKGVSCGIFINEVGMGILVIVYVIVNVDYVFCQGMWGVVEVFFVLMIICNFIVFVVFVFGMWIDVSY